ncbi:MAG: hypothetical protein US98_C0060G0007 [Parcubacteria group bacterium GW2011_GWC1_38_6]|nr:MAG: hypothetical protein US98_C0060G0007 [Parcubacteria group bacterium GW2011_GWC1_38_6]
MEYKQLGQTDFNVSRIGFGGAAISGFNYGKTDDQESIKAIKKALDLGVNFFDTADIYGFGHSEKLLADGLGERRKDVIIATKVGLRWDIKNESSFADLNRDYVYKALNQSLENLKLDTIPLYQIHRHDPDTLIRDTMETFDILKKHGKIKYLGASNLSREFIEEYSNYGRIESFQASYNILDQQAEKDIFPVCKKLEIGLIVFSPLAQGLLSGKYSHGVKFEQQDRRNESKYFKPRVFDRLPELFKAMSDIGQKYGKTMVQVALRWILDHPQVAMTIVGIKTEQQIEETAGATDWKMSKEEREKLSALGNYVMS